MYSSVGTPHFAKISVVVVEVPFSPKKINEISRGNLKLQG